MSNPLNILFLLIISSFISCNNPGAKKSTRDELNLKGSVKTITQGFDSYSQNTDDPLENFSTYMLIGPDGMKLEEKVYDIMEKKETSFFYRYDNHNNLIEWIQYENDGSVKKVKKINHYASGKIKNTALYDASDKPYLSSEYNYSIFNDNIEIIQKKIDGTIYNRIIMKYDENGNEIEVSKFDADSKVVGVIFSEYDKNNNLIVQKVYDTNADLEFILRYEYNEQNDLLKKSTYGTDGERISSIEYQYSYRGLFENWNYKKVLYDGKEYNEYERGITGYQ